MRAKNYDMGADVDIFFFILGISIITAIAASARGRSALIWWALGMLFNVIALLAVLVMPSLKAALGTPTPETHLRCPDCREFVLKGARVCKHCGCRLTGD
jgi:hypothetical protein